MFGFLLPYATTAMKATLVVTLVLAAITFYTVNYCHSCDVKNICHGVAVSQIKCCCVRLETKHVVNEPYLVNVIV